MGAPLGSVEVRRFPDGESYVRLDSDVAGRSVVVVCTLDRPDEKTVPLAYLAATARELGAARVGLVAPYLPYLRQDRRFRPGEAVAARLYASLLSRAVDWLVTAEPHLHRVHALGDVYPVPAVAVAVAPAVAGWIRAHVRFPVVVGPDAESARWVQAVAEEVGAPWTVLAKERRGDHDVVVSGADGDLRRFRGLVPLLVDDVASTGATLRAAMRVLADAGLCPATCVVVHAVFSGSAYEDLVGAGAARVVTCDTVPHPSNAIPVADRLASAALTAAGVAGR
jgi:ribose-phosphate pyrophosphokinase